MENIEHAAKKLREKLMNSPHPCQPGVRQEIKQQKTFCIPDCPLCGGQGWIRRGDFPHNHPDFGKLDPCPNRVRKHLTSGLPRYGLDEEEVKNLKWSLITPGISDGPKAVTAIKKVLKDGHGLVFMYGSFGQAKTLALKIAVAETLRAGTEAAYANMVAVLDDLRLAFDESEGKQTELSRRIERWLELPLLAIDELDKVSMTDWAGERIHQLIDQRYQQAVREKTITLVAANKDSVEIAGYLSSRFEDGRFIKLHLKGSDGRKVMKIGMKF